MKVVFVLAVITSFFADKHALPVGKERQREDVVTKCLVEVLSKAISKPDSHPLDQECKDILKGPKHAPLEKKSNEEVPTPEEEVKGHEEVPGAEDADVKDIQALLKSVAEKREDTPEDERSQESWGLDDEKEKRHREEEEEEEDGEREKRIWKPTHRYHHKKHRKRDKELSEEEPDEWRSQESWDLDDGKEKRSRGGEEREKRIWKPTHRYHHKKHRKRDEEPSEEVRGEPDEERSQESWGLDEEEEKRSLDGEERSKRAWNPTHRYRHRKLHKRDEEGSEEMRGEPDEERSQESWGLDDEEKRSSNGDEREKRAWNPTHRYRHRKLHKRDEEGSEEMRGEPDEERSQESWGLDDDKEKRSLNGDKRAWNPTHRYRHRKLHKRDEEGSEEVREGLGDDERSQESWGLDDDKEKRAEEEDEEREKRIWKPTHRYHHKKHRKRSGGSSEEDEEDEEEEERQSDSGEYEEEKRHADAEREREEALRFLAEKRGEMARHLLSEGEVYDKRSPWAYRGYYHPAWWKRSPEEHTVPSRKIEDLAGLLSLVRNEAIRHPDEKRLRQMPLSPEEGKELDSLAAMDRELQQIAEKMRDQRGD